VPIAYDAVRHGHAGPVVELLGSIATVAPASVAPVFHAHAVAVAADDGDSLIEVSKRLERLGLLVFAAEARAMAARTVAVTDARRGRWLLAEARDLLRRADVRSCAVPDLDETPAAEALTTRQLEIARLAAARWRSREIADHLGLSTRTVDNLLGRTYRSLGVTSRDELAALIETERPGE